MIESLALIAVFCTGLLAGGFFFGGLLWTVRRGLLAKHPAFWFLGSWLVRVGVVLGIFYVASAGRWERSLVCAAGFLFARALMIRFSRNESKTGIPKQGARDAS